MYMNRLKEEISLKIIILDSYWNYTENNETWKRRKDQRSEVGERKNIMGRWKMARELRNSLFDVS